MNTVKCVISVFALIFIIGNSVRRIHRYNMEERRSRLAKEQRASVELSSSPTATATTTTTTTATTITTTP